MSENGPEEVGMGFLSFFHLLSPLALFLSGVQVARAASPGRNGASRPISPSGPLPFFFPFDPTALYI